MNRRSHFLVLIVVGLAAVTLGACGDGNGTAKSEDPVVVEPIDGTDLGRLTLTASAAERLNIQTTTVESAGNGLVVPSAAVIIDPEGVYWVYTNPEPLVFIRHELQSVREEDRQAFFAAGPRTGTPVVTIGVPELYGAEFGIGK
jgi:hypothetical protein